jgi:hypothetical protein
MANWQAAEPGTVIGDGQGNYQMRVAGQWLPMPKGSLAADEHGAYHFNSDLVKPPEAPKGFSSSISASDNPTANDTEIAQGMQKMSNQQTPVGDVIDMLKAVPGGVVKMLEGIGNNVTEHPVLGNIPGLVDLFKRVAADPGGTLTSAANAVKNATPTQVGENVVAPIVAGGGISEGAGAVASRLGAEATAAEQLGLRTAQGLPAKMAGNTAGPTLDAQNNRVAATVLGADAGVPHSSPVTAQSLADARIAPGNLMDQGYGLVQPGPLSPVAREQVLAARGPATITKPTPNVANQINDIESSLLDPNGQFTGDQLRATRNSLNSDATAGANSTDADTRAVAAYKRNVVGALDQHVADSLPEGSPITQDMVSNARSTLAKNYTLQDLISKGGDINLQALAKLHRDNPNLLSGNSRTVAQFAHEHPEVTGTVSDADRISPPSLMGDLAQINPLTQPVGTIGQALFGALGRRLLRGAPGEAIGAGMQAPVAGGAGEFAPKPLTALQAPPSQAEAPHQGAMSLPEGLAPRPTLDLQAPLGTAFEPHQGAMALPEGAAPQAPYGTDLGTALGGPRKINVPNSQRGSMSFRDIERGGNDAASVNAASPEAISRGTRNLVEIGPDGNSSPVLRDVTQIDREPPPGHLIVDAGTGEIVKSGTMAPTLARGLLNRWKARGLGQSF